jgi:uncharacterized protein (TIGR03435 family)
MVRAVVSLTVFVAWAIHAQPGAGQRFDVASVRPSNADARDVSGIATGHGRLDANNVTLKRCIMGAYGVGPHQIAGGPDWLDSDRFEISAKADQPINDDAALMLMLRSLLAERFKLILHSETRPISAFVLEVAKNGPKLEKSAGGEAKTTTSTGDIGVTIDCQNVQMDAFVKILARKTELPVVNRTGLEGVFNLKLHWIPERNKPMDIEGASMFTAIPEQLGLRLRSQKVPMELLVIDHAERPSPN